MKNSTRNILAAIAVSAIMVSTAQANLLVSSGSWARLYSQTGTMLMSFTETDANYQGNAVDLAGNAYFADFSFGIRKYNGTTGAFISNVTDNTFFGAAWPVYGISSKGTGTPAGDLIASYTLGANAHFAFLDTSATNITTLSPAYGPTYEGINWSQAAQLLYATTPNGGGLMQVFNGAGGFLGQVAVGTAPKGVVRDDSNGMHYVADFGGSVWRWDGVNPASTFITGLGANSAYGVTAVGNGDIWVSNYTSGDLSRYNSSGAFQSSFNVGAGNPTYITFTAIPEPSTVGLLVMGCLGVLAAIRRCRA